MLWQITKCLDLSSFYRKSHIKFVCFSLRCVFFFLEFKDFFKKMTTIGEKLGV